MVTLDSNRLLGLRLVTEGETSIVSPADHDGPIGSKSGKAPALFETKSGKSPALFETKSGKSPARRTE